MARRDDSSVRYWLHAAVSSRWTTWVAVVSAALLSFAVIAEPDSLWQTRLGLDFLAGGPLIAQDKYSWTASGEEYLSNSWLWNVLLALGYSVAGEAGIAFWAAVPALGIMSLTVLALRNRRVPWWACTVSVLMLSFLIRPWLNARPQIADYLLTALFLYLATRQNVTHRARITVCVTGVALIVLWNNLHLTGLVGALLYAGIVFAFFAGISTVQRIVYAVCMLICGLVVCLVTPYGVDGLLKPLKTAGASMGAISEWFSPWTFYDMAHYLSVVMILLMAVAAYGLFARKRWNELAFLLGLIVVASYQNRWVPLAAIVGIVWVTEWAVSLSGKTPERVKSVAMAALLAFVVPSLAVSLTALSPANKATRAEYGASLVKLLPSGCKMLNLPESGGPILLYRPDVKASMDGRNDFYGIEKYIEQNHVLFTSQDGWAVEWVDEHKINCVIANERRTTLQDRLRETGEWSDIAVDGDFVLMVRTTRL